MTNRQPQPFDQASRGPGLMESMMWVSGYHLAQTLAGGIASPIAAPNCLQWISERLDGV
ncbi:MAG: hypothetical protein R3B91_05765 [Planctomycetaceae bacterium]